MPGRVDQVEVVDLPVFGLVLQRRRLRLDRDATLALDVHRVQHLGFHLAVRTGPATLNDPIRERALAVVDVGNDGKLRMWFIKILGTRSWS